MKKVILASLSVLFLFSIAFAAGTATLEWTVPTTYSDGSPLPQGDLSLFKIYRGTTSGVYSTITSVPSTTNQYTITTLPTGTHYFVVTAVTITSKGGLESDYSNEMSKNIAPVKPGTCILQIR